MMLGLANLGADSCRQPRICPFRELVSRVHGGREGGREAGRQAGRQGGKGRNEEKDMTITVSECNFMITST